MKKILLIVLMVLSTIHVSGCATILGGIIGHQSGEAAAGVAIGAGVDVICALSGMAKKEEIKKSVKVHPELGYIRVGSIAAKKKNVETDLKKRFQETHWTLEKVETQSPEKEISVIKYQCKTYKGKNFIMEITKEQRQDLRIYIKLAEESNLIKCPFCESTYHYLCVAFWLF